MINLRSVVDGFRVILLGYVQNLVLALTMIIVVRPPIYEDDEDHNHTTKARYFYYGLIVYHLTVAIVRYLSLFHFKELRSKMTIFMMIAVFLMSYISQAWVYRQDIDDITKSPCPVVAFSSKSCGFKVLD